MSTILSINRSNFKGIACNLHLFKKLIDVIFCTYEMLLAFSRKVVQLFVIVKSLSL